MEPSFTDQTLGDIACSLPGAVRVFRDFGIEFCCDGGKTLAQAAHDQMLDISAIVSQLESLDRFGSSDPDWRTAPIPELIIHIIDRYHERHRTQLPELTRLARRVEMVHAGSPGCPAGLADVLENLDLELESHMVKEERVLFPLLSRDLFQQAQVPLSVLRLEHDQHRHTLKTILVITNKLTLPDKACNTWRALYTGLQEFTEDLMEHIHLENNILFLNASNVAQGALNG